MVRAMHVEEKICVNGGRCIEHELRCDDASYSSKLSAHTTKDWPTDYKSDFKPSRDRETNANFNTYKKWGIGEMRFFSISDNFDAPAESSRTLYFSMNYHNMPRLVGATFFNASTGQVEEFEFVYEEDDSTRVGFSSSTKERKLVAERSYAAAKTSVAKTSVAKQSVAKPSGRVVELLRSAVDIERVDLARTGGDHEVVATLDPSWVPRLKSQLVGADTLDDLTNTPPAWPLAVRLFVDGVDAPYVGLPVGYDRLRFNPHDPWSSRIALDDGRIDPEVLEVLVGEAFIDHVAALARAANEPRGKEHRARH